MRYYLDAAKIAALIIFGIGGGMAVLFGLLFLSIEVSAWFVIPLVVVIFIGLTVALKKIEDSYR